MQNLLRSDSERILELRNLLNKANHAYYILDEPFLGLDQETVNIIGQTISDHLLQNGAVILSSHVPVSITSKKYIDLDLHESN